MSQKNCDITIIGAGLTGLTIAHLLKNSTFDIQILEARNRIGGRIETIREKGFAPMEMGATWLGKKHKILLELLQELGLPIFEQKLGRTAIYEPISTSPPQLVQLPPNDAPSFRIKNGSDAVIQQLAKSIHNYCPIHLREAVLSIEEKKDKMLVKTATQSIESNFVISTLPPYLLSTSIDLPFSIPTDLKKIMQETHTWMGESIKIGLYYDTAFWREKNLSGTVFSSVGPISEFYDHSNAEDNRFALKGFLNSSYHSISKEERLTLILKQLQKYFGTKANDYLAYEEKVWRKESFTFSPYKIPILPHQNNANPVYRQPYCGGKFFIAGSETASEFAGYMDGAVRSALLVAGCIDF